MPAFAPGLGGARAGLEGGRFVMCCCAPPRRPRSNFLRVVAGCAAPPSGGQAGPVGGPPAPLVCAVSRYHRVLAPLRETLTLQALGPWRRPCGSSRPPPHERRVSRRRGRGPPRYHGLGFTAPRVRSSRGVAEAARRQCPGELLYRPFGLPWRSALWQRRRRPYGHGGRQRHQVAAPAPRD